ncbi:serine/threonine protein kinase [Pseudogymnoascus sp. WSF 3629]|nr:serine/threonine protein kinase [Pseudogymnoascus sp. WSF 3629]
MSSAEMEIIEYRQYCPPGVQRVIASGTSAWIDRSRLELEYEILCKVGKHPRIIGLKRLSTDGLYLERAPNGTLHNFILSNHPTISLQQRLAWCREATEAVVHIHSKRVIHCDIQPTNLLLDETLHLKLSDFQGNYLSETGEVILEGGSAEPCRFFCPRDDPFHADVKTDLFALGCTVYFIMMGYCVFPDIVDGEEGWHDRVRSRFENAEFPRDSHACSAVTAKCWELKYISAIEVLRDIEEVEKKI